MAPRRIAFFVFPRLTLRDVVGADDVLRRVAAQMEYGGDSPR